jgi:hypothetical protein
LTVETEMFAVSALLLIMLGAVTPADAGAMATPLDEVDVVPLTGVDLGVTSAKASPPAAATASASGIPITSRRLRRAARSLTLIRMPGISAPFHLGEIQTALPEG